MIRLLSILLITAAAAALAGCNTLTLSRPGPPQVDHVDRMDLWVAPSAIQLTGRPAPDGVELRLYLYSADPSSTQPGLVREGQFQFLAYEGRALTGTQNVPFFQWEYSAQQMRPFFTADKYGLGSYHATLSWVPKIPASNTISIIARYSDPQGRIVVSAPADVMTRSK
jgi:hypothetical protein